MNSREIALASIIAALYAVLVYLLPFMSFLLWQVRVADALIALTTVLGYPAVLGVTVGCFIGNILAAPWGSAALNAFDAFLGSLMNLVAGYAGYRIARKGGERNRIIALVVQVLVISVGVGSYLKYLLLWAFGTDVPVLLSIAGVLPGSVISIVVLGYPLSLAVERSLKGLRGRAS
ncbi:QueT transporter family protein [Infirmifilum lucidum]|uniref:QueT transporter family protein n=1 Tax=Infirmifilum lucidum TaxID=2776706 RepID=A0A7L9FGA0_9CREN|nr:QueT transporter family protein [Infirmifilum lucidum]QOJ78727.1 QueT transporter family protein [Infirmifilum lucidum]